MSASKTERLLALSLVLINASRPLTRSEIRDAVRDYPADAKQDAFERMFERDKDELRSMGIPIESVEMDATEGIGYRVERSEVYLQPIEVTAGERMVLAIASRMWGEASWGHDAVNALRKLELVGDFSSDDSASVAVSVRVDSGVVSSLLEATSEHRVVTFDYLKAGAGQPSSRHLQPWGVVASRGHWYVVGFDTDRNDTRAFRLSRVVGHVKVAKKPTHYEIPTALDLHQLIQASFPVAERFDIEVRLSPGHAVALRELAGIDSRVESVVIPNADPQRVLSAALAAGEHAEIIEPRDLREQAADALDLLASQADFVLSAQRLSELDLAAHNAERRSAEATSARLSRLLALVPWLLAHPGVTFEDAAAHFGIRPERLRADLTLAVCTEFGSNLLTLDIDIWSNRITVFNPQGIQQPLRLTTPEAVSLLLGLRLLAQMPGSQDNADLASAIDKIEAAAGEASALAAHVTVASPISPQTAGGLATSSTLDSALSAGHAVELVYRNASRDELSQRIVDPIGLLATDGHSYLQAWCRQAEAVRLFRVDRIDSATELAEPAVVPESAGPRLTAVTPQGPDVTLVVAPNIAWWAEQVPAKARLTLPDGSVAVRVPVASEEWLRRTVLGFGGRMRVAEPADLATRVAAEAWTALQQYR